ncbi:nuclease-related domain-containing protein [Ornithinibacillus scapharcae]|uniref:nuclease-related domain-containing protein n=1 Tax=Ornithinibacillus scapharcae TaxID=1147159 RepID=UPI000225B2AB|nr:nuclease-related domain-containing protein [Ornithinibacillus scapharcae]
MIIKSRTKSKQLIILELLDKRYSLASDDKQYCLNLSKGYEGEVIFDTLTKDLHCDCLIINDLLLESKNTTFQIDTLIITKEKIYVYEIKNYEGDYYFETDKLYKKPNYEIVNPLNQLSRSTSLIRQLLLTLGYNLPIQSFVIFINSNFTLYQAPMDKPIIFPTQVKSHLSLLNTIQSTVNEKHRKLAENLIQLHKKESAHIQIPSYDYSQLTKGITCFHCNSFIRKHALGPKQYICSNCQHAELIDKAILENIREYKLLFPNEKITTSSISDWCEVVSERRIRNLLNRYFTKKGEHRWSYYE